MLSATLTQQNQDIFISEWILSPIIIRCSSNRPEIKYEFLEVNNTVDSIAYFIQHEISPTLEGAHRVIIYCPTKAKINELFEKIQSIIMCEKYSSDIPDMEKEATILRWKSGDSKVMICTNGFGLGIDFATVRFVIHLDNTQSVAAYHQETGRGGRDGKPCRAVLFYNNDGFNKAIISRKGQLDFDEFKQVVQSAQCRRTSIIKCIDSKFENCLLLILVLIS